MLERTILETIASPGHVLSVEYEFRKLMVVIILHVNVKITGAMHVEDLIIHSVNAEEFRIN